MDWSIGIAVAIIVIICMVYITGIVTFPIEKYGNYNDLSWAAGLPGTCKTCNSDYDPNLGEVNLMRNTLKASMVPSKVDYYGLPQGQTYYGSALSDALPGKLWNVAKQ